MRLWTAHIKALSGFYASDAYVVASDREAALARLMAGVDAYTDDRIAEYGCLPGVSVIDSDEDFEAELKEFRAKVEAEARDKLHEVPGGAIIDVRI